MNNKRVSNNRFLNCPARMDDGRHFTNYCNNTSMNVKIRKDNNLKKDSNAYRKYLIENAEKLMKKNKEDMNKINSCLCHKLN